MTRGEIWWADFGLPFGSEPGFRRPVLLVQNDAFNASNIRTVIIVPMTTNLGLEEAPGNVFLDKTESKLAKDSVIVVSQISVIARERLIQQAGRILKKTMSSVEDGIRLVLGFDLVR